jgi:hypothetical protein
MEDSRDFYLSQFLDLVPYGDDVLERVWRRLVRTPQRNLYFSGSQSQMRWLATRYALRGNEGARRALKMRVSKNLLAGETRGFDSLLAVEGKSCLPHVVSILEQESISFDADAWSRIRYELEDEFGEEWLTNWILSLPATYRTAHALLDVSSGSHDSYEATRWVKTLDDLMSTAKGEPLDYYACANFTQNASEEEFVKAARSLPSEPQMLASYLRIFTRRRPWPIEPQPLFEASKSKNWKVVRECYSVLENVISPEVRRFALRRIGLRYEGQLAVDILRVNYEPGDENLIRERSEKCKSLFEMHYVLMPFRELLEAQPEIDDSLVEYLYSANPCSYCRESIVKRMIERNLVTHQIRNECLHDASEDTRLMVGGPAA